MFSFLRDYFLRRRYGNDCVKHVQEVGPFEKPAPQNLKPKSLAEQLGYAEPLKRSAARPEPKPRSAQQCHLNLG